MTERAVVAGNSLVCVGRPGERCLPCTSSQFQRTVCIYYVMWLVGTESPLFQVWDTTTEGCRAACESTPECAGFVYALRINGTEDCFLKTRMCETPNAEVANERHRAIISYYKTPGAHAHARLNT